MPYAQVSSLEDPCTENTDYVKAPSTSIEAVTKGVEMARAQVSGFSKPEFGKYSRSSGEASGEGLNKRVQAAFEVWKEEP